MTDFPGVLDRPSALQIDAATYGAQSDEYYRDGTSKGEFTVTDISTAEVVTVAVTHNYQVGDFVSFSGTTSTPSLGSTPIYNITAVTATTFTIAGVDVTVGGASAGTVRNHTVRSATARFTSADVGKNIIAIRVGPSTLQDLHTTITSVSSSTVAVLTDRTHPGRNNIAAQASVGLYLSRQGGQDVFIQNAINYAAGFGGAEVVLNGVGYLTLNTITMKPRTGLGGRGPNKRQTCVHPGTGVNKPVITNDQTSNDYAQFCTVRNLWIDGNRQRNTTDFTTTLNGAYTAGGTPITLTTTTGMQNSGSFMVVNATTKSVTGAVASGTTIRLTVTGHGMTTGDMVTVASVGGVTAATGRWTITVIDANTMDLYGSTFSGVYTSGGTVAWTVFFTYESISGSTVVTAAGGCEGSIDHSLATGSAVTQVQNHGIIWIANPFNTTPTLAEVYDPFQRVENCLIKNCRGSGYESWGQAENRVIDVHVELTDGLGFRIGFDHWVHACTCSYAGRMGYYMRYSGIHVTLCKAWYCGSGVAQEGHGFMFEGPVTIEEGTKVLSSCHAQDNKAHGFYGKTAQRVSLQGQASSNSTSCAGAFTGLALDGCTLGNFNVMCTERVATPTQTSALLILNTSVTTTGNAIWVSHGGAQGAGALSTAIKSTSGLTGGNDIRVNSSGPNSYTVASPAIAGTTTPDPYVAGKYDIQMPAGVITIANPSNGHLGLGLVITIIQDGSGSHTVTWGANYKFSGATAPTLTLTASRRDIFTFYYNGTNWVEQARSLNVG